MTRYYITDRLSLAQSDKVGALLDCVRSAIASGVDYIQVREKDLGGRALADLVRQVVTDAKSSRTRILVNTRADIAIACAADGVHLPGDSIAPSEIRRLTARNLIVSVACHSMAEVRLAASEGADLAIFSPIFETASKAAYGPPLGLDMLKQAAGSVSIPVLALGGITEANARDCIEACAAGIAGISMFQREPQAASSTGKASADPRATLFTP